MKTVVQLRLNRESTRTNYVKNRAPSAVGQVPLNASRTMPIDCTVLIVNCVDESTGACIGFTQGVQALNAVERFIKSPGLVGGTSTVVMSSTSTSCR